MKEPTEAQLQAVQALADARHGALLPEEVINAAKSRRSPLNEHFEWDDAVAGHEYRMEQARTLIKAVKIEVVYHGYSLRAPAFLRPAGDRSGVYVSPARLSTDEDVARATVVLEFRRASQALQRARLVAITLGLEGDVDTLIGGVTEALSKAEEDRARG